MMTNKRFRLFSRNLAAFAVTLLLGILINSLSGNYFFIFTVKETFTESEAAAKLNKRVIENIGNCFEDSKAVKGRIVSYARSKFDGQINLEIKWDKPISGKFEKVNIGVELYKMCVSEIDEQ